LFLLKMASIQDGVESKMVFERALGYKDRK